MKKARLSNNPELDHAKEWITIFNEDLGQSSLNIDSPSGCNINDTKLQTALFEYFTNAVPGLLKKTHVSGVLKFVVEDENFKKTIAEPLEEFICHDVCPEGFDELSSYGKPSKFCGKVFGVGDPTFSCKDCGADPTCVLCNECFQKSEHRHHRYKLHTSGGNGGYCDCGDLEAWSTHPACELHVEGLEIDESWDPLSALPTDIQRRGTFVLSFLLQYCVDLICWEECDELPDPLRIISTKNDSHIVMLFNDESHTYDEVINTLQTAIKCTAKDAVHFATIVDKEGRSAIYTDKSAECHKVVSVCRACTSRNRKKPLKCEAIHRDIIAHQLVALEIMAWLNTVVDKSDGLRRLLSILVSQRLVCRPESILKQIIHKDTELWKAVRSHTHQLFMNALLMDMYGRMEFAKVFAESYKTIMQDFIADDHEHAISVSALSVQIFTVPTIAEALISKYNILKTCFESFWAVLEVCVNKDGCLDFQNSGAFPDLQRSDYILNDLRYILRNKPKWTDLLRSQFLESMDVFVKILVAMQEMDSMQRQTSSHIPYEPQWETAFHLQLWIAPVFKLVLSWCQSDLTIYNAVMDKCITALRKRKLKSIEKDGTIMVKHFVLVNPVSMHNALSRFIAGLLPGVTNFSLNLSETLKLQFFSDDLAHSQLIMMEYSLRTLVLVSQINAGMWRRNGYAAMHSAYHYQNVRFASEMFDRDLMIMQAMASIMDPNNFINILLHKFYLKAWSSDTYKGDEDVSVAEVQMQKYSKVIAEEFFLLLLHILTERYVLGLSDTTKLQILKREVMHRLSLGPTSRSSLVQALPTKDPIYDDCSFEGLLDNVLEEIAVYREPGVSGKGLFELKKDYFMSCNQFFFHFTKAEQSKMSEERKKRLKKDGLETIDFLPLPPKFHPQFEGVLNLLTCTKLQELLKLVLRRSIDEKYHTDELTEAALLIIASGLLEEKRCKEEENQVKDFKFTDIITEKQTEEDKSILDLIDELSQKPRSYTPMINWLRKLAQSQLRSTDSTQMEVDGAASAESDLKEKADRQRKIRLAKERQQKMMTQMKTMQQAFMKQHKMFDDIEDDDDVMEELKDNTESLLEDMRTPQAIGVHRSTTDNTPLMGQCILCHQEEEPINNGHFVVTCFQMKSDYMKRRCIKNRQEIYPELNEATKVNISSCGHVLHSQCWEKYYKTVSDREGFLLQQQRPRTCVDTKQNEYLCPLCHSLCNTVLPILPRDDEEPCSDNQDISLTEFFAYLERFSAVPEEKHSGKRPSAVSSYLRKVYNTCNSFLGKKILHKTLTSKIRYKIVFRTDTPTPTEDFLELYLKKLLEMSKPDPTVPSSDIALSWITTSFSLQSFESSCRVSKKNMFNNLSDRQNQFWYALVQFLSATSHNSPYNSAMQSFAENVFNFFSGSSTTSDELNILDVDMLGLMISLRFIVSLIQNTFEEPNYIKISPRLINDGCFKLCLRAYIVKTFITAPVFQDDITDNEVEVVSTADQQHVILDTWKYIMEQCSSTNVTNNAVLLKEHMVSSLMPFLRCSTFFFHFLTGVKLPDELKQETVVNELGMLLHYLNLPKDLNVMFSKAWLTDETRIENTIKSWCNCETVKQQIKNRTIERIYVEPRRLVNLPYNYSELINKASGFRCPTVGDFSRSPALCLLCDTLICNQCYCCMKENEYGACAMHSMECANGIGLFLRIRESEVILMFNRKKGSLMPSPYLDQYGEPDKGFRRGNPLFLSQKRYDQFEQLWLQQRVPEAIAQSMEMNRGFLVFDWQTQ